GLAVVVRDLGGMLSPAARGGSRVSMRDVQRGPAPPVVPASRAIAAALLSPPLPFGLRQVAGSTRLFTIGLLPAVIRRRYGYAWTRTRARAFDALSATIRIGLPVLPRVARTFPHARR